jgi:hypothetical protein
MLIQNSGLINKECRAGEEIILLSVIKEKTIAIILKKTNPFAGKSLNSTLKIELKIESIIAITVKIPV